MRLTRGLVMAAGLMLLSVLAPAFAQEAPQLFAPAPSSPPVPRTIPVTRAALDETPPSPTPRPTPEIRSPMSEAPQLFAPAPNSPPVPRTIPVTRATLDETQPLPTPRPTPEIRSTMSEAPPRPAPEIRTLNETREIPPTPQPRPQYQPPPVAFADGVTAQFDVPYATDLTGSFCTKRNVRTRFGREFLSCRRRGLVLSRS
jgi:hypothetical protein